jgi:DHA3 family macrolide efflux protein-like MFS transporter
MNIPFVLNNHLRLAIILAQSPTRRQHETVEANVTKTETNPERNSLLREPESAQNPSSGHLAAGAPSSLEAAADPPVAEPSMTPFLTLWVGQSLSLFGSAAAQFALIWWLTATTGSATVLAAATFVGLVPQIALGPVIGALVDRWNRKAIMLAADAFVAAASLALAVLFATGNAGTVHVLALLFARALGSAFHEPAMVASATLMVPQRHFARVHGINQSLEGLLLIVGAPLGALLYGLLPMAGVMLVDVATALLAIVPLSCIAVPHPPRVDGERPPTLVHSMVAGYRYLRRRRGHLTLIGIASVMNLLLVPAFSLLPLLVLERIQGDAAELGWISSACGVGMLAGGLLLGIWGGGRRRIVTTLSAMIALGFAVLAVGATPEGSFAWLLAAMLTVGAIVPAVNGPVHAILQATIAPEYQGRVFALLGSLAGATAPVGLLFATPVAELVGVRTWYFAGGVACIAMGAAGLLAPALMRIEDEEGTRRV